MTDDDTTAARRRAPALRGTSALQEASSLLDDVLAAVRSGVASRTRSARNASTERPAEDPQVLRIVGAVAADAALVRAALAGVEALPTPVSPTATAPAVGGLEGAAPGPTTPATAAAVRLAERAATRLFDALGASSLATDLALDDLAARATRLWRSVDVDAVLVTLGTEHVRGEQPDQEGRA